MIWTGTGCARAVARMLLGRVGRSEVDVVPGGRVSSTAPAGLSLASVSRRSCMTPSIVSVRSGSDVHLSIEPDLCTRPFVAAYVRAPRRKARRRGSGLRERAVAFLIVVEFVTGA